MEIGAWHDGGIQGWKRSQNGANNAWKEASSEDEENGERIESIGAKTRENGAKQAEKCLRTEVPSMSGPRYNGGPRWWTEVWHVGPEVPRTYALGPRLKQVGPEVPPCRSMSVVALDSFLFGIFLLIPIIVLALEPKEF